jgi:AraC-like DNA-binding protein
MTPDGSPPAAEKDTVSAYFVDAALARLDPAARQRALASAGLVAPRSRVERQARVPANAYSALWLAVARELDDEFFGLDRRAMKVGSFALLCQAVVPCPTLERAVRRMLRGFAVLLDDVGARLRIESDVAVIALDNRITDAASSRFADETLLVLLHGLMCWLIGRRLALLQVDFAHPRPPQAAEYTVMFCEHIRFHAAQTCIRFDAAALTAPVVQNASTLRQFLATAPQSVFLKYRNEDSWTVRVRRHLRMCLERQQWPVFADVAACFDVAPTTLRRRIEAEGTSFQGIKDRLRSDLAIDWLADGQLSVDEIAARLGFQDPSAFHRAFVRWNGVQPGRYRRGRDGVVASAETA